MGDYNKRLVEVDEVLNHLSKRELLKIPEEIRQVIKENKDKEYIWQYDETKSLQDQDLSRDAIVFLTYLNMTYLLNEEQRNLMEQILELNERKLEEKKAKQYKVEDLFEKKQNAEKINDSKEELAIIEVKKETFFKKIINKIKSIFKK